MRFVFVSFLIHLGIGALLFMGSSEQTSFLVPLGVEMQATEPAAATAKVSRPRVVVPSTAPSVPSTSENLQTENTNAPTAIGAVGPEGKASGSAEVSAEDRYLYELRTLLERKKRYPVLAKKMGQTGKVVVRFTLAQDGSLVSSEILERSEHEALNEAAAELVKSISGLKPFPKDIPKNLWNITIPIEYSIN